VALLAGFAVIATACGGDDDADEPTGDVVETEAPAPTDETGTEATEPTEAPEETEAPRDPVAAAQRRVDDATEAVADAQSGLDDANEEFCANTEDYVDALDRYGKLFTDREATVGDVRVLGEDLVEPRETVEGSIQTVFDARDALAAAQQELTDAEVALVEAIATASSIPTSSVTPETTTTTTIVPQATVDRVEQAEQDLADVTEGITDATPLSEATAEFNSAALALQIAWMRVLLDAGCLDDEQQANAINAVTAFTANLQTQLQLVGLYSGAIDGIYGPDTVAAVKQLQKDAGLRETGYMDRATSEALDALLAEVTQQEADLQRNQAAAVQGVLTLLGYWTAPIDGIWSAQLEIALKQFQTDLGVPPTGAVDAATLAAIEQAIAALAGIVAGTTPPTVPPTEPPATEPPAPEPTAPPETEPATVTTVAEDGTSDG
jgi:peptidoglycan hydrolase-like protein with peptidoglycan-binding domain